MMNCVYYLLLTNMTNLTEKEEKEYQILFKKNKQYQLTVSEKNRLKVLKAKKFPIKEKEND